MTVTFALPDVLLRLAVMVVAPSDTALNRPVFDVVAKSLSPVTQLTNELKSWEVSSE